MLQDIDDLIETETETIEEEPGLEEDISNILALWGEEYHGLRLLIRQTMQHPVLSREQEQELFKIIKRYLTVIISKPKELIKRPYCKINYTVFVGQGDH